MGPYVVSYCWALPVLNEKLGASKKKLVEKNNCEVEKPIDDRKWWQKKKHRTPDQIWTSHRDLHVILHQNITGNRAHVITTT